MSVRPATPDDAEALVAQTQAAFARYAYFAPQEWLDALDFDDQLARLRDTLENPDAVVMVSEDGAGHFAWRREERRAHLLALFVEPHRWGSGLAGELHAHTLQTMRARGYRQASLFTPAGQARARRFYEREGWYRVGEAYLKDPFGLDLVEYHRQL